MEITEPTSVECVRGSIRRDICEQGRLGSAALVVVAAVVVEGLHAVGFGVLQEHLGAFGVAHALLRVALDAEDSPFARVEAIVGGVFVWY